MSKHRGVPHPTDNKHPGQSGRFSKQRRPFGDPVALPATSPRFTPIPFAPPAHLNLPLSAVLHNAVDRKRLQAAKSLTFHCVGDTGGIHGTDTQEAIAHVMERQIHDAPDTVRPWFLYHLGDVVYFNGLEREYGTQFYEPYQFYPAPIFAVPGNHDGDTHVRKGDEPDNESSLTGFRENFCAPHAVHVNKYRELMTQPYVYWTLEAPFVTIVGLYSNVDGLLDGRGTVIQQRWLTEQIKSAPKNKFLVLAVHHPPYSLDSAHGGSPAILDALETAVSEASDRWPDVVLSGHVHNYQRFQRVVGKKKIPFIVAGAGGYANEQKSLHKLQVDSKGKRIPDKASFKTTISDVSLEHYDEDEPGFLRITVDPKQFKAEYFQVPFDSDKAEKMVDTVVVDKG
jgi:hypothetical protein